MQIGFILLSAIVLVQSWYNNDETFNWVYKDRPDISYDAFLDYNLTKLKNVIISNCKTVTLHWNTFTNLTELTDLSVTNNEIYQLDIKLLRDTWNLKRINFAHNEIRSLENGVFKNLTKVTTITLSDNHIDHVGESVFEDMRLLESLDLSANRISYFYKYTFATNENLIKLNFYENALIYLNDGLFARQYRVEELNLAQNRITEITKYTFVNMHKLRTLKMFQNEIVSVARGAFDNNTELSLIEMHRNNIQDLESGLFVNARGLQTLDLGINLISHIGGDVFPQSIRILKLSGNKLQYMDVSVISKLRNLYQLVLYNNPWRCNCHLIPFYQASLRYEDPIAKTRCAEPKNLKDKIWDDLDPKNFTCTANEPAPTPKPKVINEVTFNDTLTEVIILSAGNHVAGNKLLVNTGDNATFYLDIQGHPWLLAHWFLHNENITINHRSASGKFYERFDMSDIFGISIGRFALTIQDARPADNGEYVCRVENMWKHTITVETFYLAVYSPGEEATSTTLIWLLFITIIILYALFVILKFKLGAKDDKFDKPVLFQTIFGEMGKFRKGTNGQGPTLLENTEDTDSVLCIEVSEESAKNKSEVEETVEFPIIDLSTDEKEDSEQGAKPATIDVSDPAVEPSSESNTQEFQEDHLKF